LASRDDALQLIRFRSEVTARTGKTDDTPASVEI